MQTRGVFFKPGLSGLTASKTGFDCVSPAVLYSTVTGHLSEADSRYVNYMLRGGRRLAVRWMDHGSRPRFFLSRNLLSSKV